MEVTTTFFPRSFRTSSWISWEGPTPPPGELTRRTSALTESSFANLRICPMTGSESAISPMMGTMPTFPLPENDISPIRETIPNRRKNPAIDARMTAHPRRNGRRPRRTGDGLPSVMRPPGSLPVDLHLRPGQRLPESGHVFRGIGRAGHVGLQVLPLHPVLVRANAQGDLLAGPVHRQHHRPHRISRLEEGVGSVDLFPGELGDVDEPLDPLLA